MKVVISVRISSKQSNYPFLGRTISSPPFRSENIVRGYKKNALVTTKVEIRRNRKNEEVTSVQ